MGGEGENGIAVQNTGIAINPTNFPDVNFRSFVAEKYDTDRDEYLSNTEIAAVTELNCYNRGISDLTGIGHFTALTKLSCNANQLTSLDVSKNSALTYLSCYGNQLTVLDVSKNTSFLSGIPGVMIRTSTPRLAASESACVISSVMIR